MATKSSKEQQLERLRLKKEQLDLRIKKDEIVKREKEVRSKLRITGGRV